MSEHPSATRSIVDDVVVRLQDLQIRNTATGAPVVHGVSFALRRGGVLGIVGESGSGKTVTCRAILGILPPQLAIHQGSAEVLGHDVGALDAAEWTKLRGTSIGAIFQDPGSYLNPSVRIGRQMAGLLRIKRGLRRGEAAARALQLLHDVRIRNPEAVYQQYPFELSGGMLQRVLIAMALSLEPDVLIADEATTALDVTVQAEILDLLRDLRERANLSMIFVSHDLAVVAQLCDDVLVMREGRVVEHGPTAQVLRTPRHDYTRLLVSEHALYGLERFTNAEDEPPRVATEAAPRVVQVAGAGVTLGAGRGARQILHDIGLDIGRGQSVGVIGETGSGKTTLARMLVGLVATQGGTVQILEEDIRKLKGGALRTFRRRGAIQYVFQDPLRSLDPDITVGDSLAEPLRIRGGLSQPQIHQRILQELRQVRLAEELLDRLPAELSGGQRQRVLIARALVAQPDILVLDEPVSALDAANRVQVLEILNRLRAGGTTLVFISHDLGSVAGVTDQVVVLFGGRIVEAGATRQVVTRPRHAYTQLLLGSAPTLESDGSIGRARRDGKREPLETAAHTLA